jgi:hypothetical protein
VRRRDLGLTEVDVFDLKTLAGHHLVSASVGVVALSVAVFAPLAFAPLSPATLGLMGPGHALWGVYHTRRRKALEARLAAAARPVILERPGVERALS